MNESSVSYSTVRDLHIMFISSDVLFLLLQMFFVNIYRVYFNFSDIFCHVLWLFLLFYLYLFFNMLILFLLHFLSV